MHKDGQRLLNLMFLPDESVCVTNSKFSYHSIPLSLLNAPIKLISPPGVNEDKVDRAIYCSSSELILAALNPIEGYCRDINVKAYRNFLIEIDVGTIDQQIDYIKRSGIPYSAMVFSGNKSVHVLISLDKPLDDEKSYRKTFQWINNILPLIDEHCINPSRKIRIPGVEREPGKIQKLLEFKGKVLSKDLADWLNKHPLSAPKERKKSKPSDKADISQIKPWAAKMLNEGFPAGMGRNHGWFSLGAEWCSMGFSEEEAIEMLGKFFVEEDTFPEKEWLTAINSGYKHFMGK